jgi:hypothetical protein
MSEKSVAQKLLFKPGQTVWVVNPPPDIIDLLGKIPDQVEILSSAMSPVDIIQMFSASRQALEEQLPRVQPFLKPGGILWVTYYKGTARVKTDINRDTINAYAHTLGLEGVAMISVNEDWSAMRFKASSR